MARPAGGFNAERYFRGDHGLQFYNIGTKPMRAFARSIHHANRESWSIVALLPLVRTGAALDLGYKIAARLHNDEEDLIQKAVGGTLRETGKANRRRLERYAP